MANEAIHIWVSGKVQGVYFRASTAKKAQKLNLCGWVQNLPDDRVEILAQGEAESLRQLLLWCQKGPVLARVSEITQQAASLDRQLNGFEVRR
ncbi:MAG: acylphosphatase [Bermanella sp.]